MGEEIHKEHFEKADYDAFEQRVEQEMGLLRKLFADRAFDNSSRLLGYELELCLADQAGKPSRTNTRVIDAASNPLFTTELARFNMEINGNVFTCRGDVFSQIEADLADLYRQAEKAAGDFDSQIGMFGVFPSVSEEHLNPDTYMTELHRYKLLNRQLLHMRGRPVQLHLDGEEKLDIEKHDVMLEALATSLQIHMQVPFDEIVPTYHAGLWSSMLVLAATANSPLVLGKCCWQESRIGIFKQSVDTRNPRRNRRPHRPPRSPWQGIHRIAAGPVRGQFLLQPYPARSAGPTAIEDLHHLALAQRHYLALGKTYYLRATGTAVITCDWSYACCPFRADAGRYPCQPGVLCRPSPKD